MRHQLLKTLFKFFKFLIHVYQIKTLKSEMFLKNYFKKFLNRFLNQRFVFSISHVKDVARKSHLRVLNAIEIHAINHKTYFENLHIFTKKYIQFMLSFRLIKIRFFHDFVTFVAKNVSKNVFKSQDKFN